MAVKDLCTKSFSCREMCDTSCDIFNNITNAYCRGVHDGKELEKAECSKMIAELNNDLERILHIGEEQN